MRWLLAALALSGLLVLTTITGTLAALGGGSAFGSSTPSPTAVADIPPEYLRLYVVAAEAEGIDWAILAAIGKVESDHGRGPAEGIRRGLNFAGCCAGPMQFYVVGPSSTWDAYGVDGDRDGDKDVYDPADAIPAAAAYLVASGAPGDYRRALFAYNHAGWYVEKVLEQAERYRQAAGTPAPIRIGGSGSASAVLRNPRIVLTPQMQADIRAGRIDQRLLAVLAWIGRGRQVVLNSLLRPYDSDSNHSAGRAMDIASIDGEACNGSRSGLCGRIAVALARISGPLHSTELIYCFDPDPASADAFAAADHCDHVHVGWDG